MATILSLLPTYTQLLTFSAKRLEGMLPTAAYYVPHHREWRSTATRTRWPTQHSSAPWPSNAEVAALTHSLTGDHVPPSTGSSSAAQERLMTTPTQPPSPPETLEALADTIDSQAQASDAQVTKERLSLGDAGQAATEEGASRTVWLV